MARAEAGRGEVWTCISIDAFDDSMFSGVGTGESVYCVAAVAGVVPCRWDGTAKVGLAQDHDHMSSSCSSCAHSCLWSGAHARMVQDSQEGACRGLGGTA